ncbi:MAG: Gfo/Idh/MocA family oxidoreductase [Deltaproteobacteria bacterium]|nr:Gfo/Idh/MocA family oxidoreductase [Deltaproteobacteria bacterium]
MTIRYGIIGCGGIADGSIAPAMARAKDSSLHSVLSRDQAKAERFAQKHGATVAYSDLEAFLSDRDLDAVFIATPNGQHAFEAIAAAEAGKHVLVEKPMATSSVDCRRMIEACGQAKVRLMVGYHLRFHPVHREVDRLVRAGHLGQLVTARSQFYFRYPTAPPEWRRYKSSAGGWATMDVGTHAVDLLRWFGGEVTEVTAYLSSPRFGYETEDAAHLLVKFENGGVGILDCSTSTYTPKTKLELYGLKGFVFAAGTLGGTGTGEMDYGDHESTHHFEFQPNDPFQGEIEEFTAAIQEEREPFVTGLDGLKNLQILEAAYLSAAEGRIVQVR